MNHMTDIEAYSSFVLTREDDAPMQIIDIHDHAECAYCGSQYETWQQKCSSCGAQMPEPRHRYDGTRLGATVTVGTKTPGMTCQQWSDKEYLRKQQELLVAANSWQ